MKNREILVSIIIPTFNRGDFLIRAVKSVLNQDFRDWECIIIDDNSLIPAAEILKNIIHQDNRFKIIRNSKNKFISESRNIGIQYSQGNYIAFLDDDDYWHHQKLNLQLDFMKRNNYGVSYCWSIIINKNNKKTFRQPFLEGNIFDLMLADQPLCNCSTLVAKKKILEETGGFNKLLKRGNDGDLLRRLSQYNKIGVLKENLVYYQVNTNNTNISLNNNIGIKRSLKSYKYRLVLFKKEIKNRPIIYSLICLEISKCYAKLGNFNMALRYFINFARIQISNMILISWRLLKIFCLIICIPFFKIKKFFLKSQD